MLYVSSMWIFFNETCCLLIRIFYIGGRTITYPKSLIKLDLE